MKYPMIEKLGLKPVMHTAVTYGHMVDADYLEKVLENAQRVYGCKVNDMDFTDPQKQMPMHWDWNDKSTKYDTHTALFLCIEPMKKGVTKGEVSSMIKNFCPIQFNGQDVFVGEMGPIVLDLLRRIEKEGIVD